MLQTLALNIHHGDVVPLAAVVGGIGFVTLVCLGGMISSVLKRRQVEQSRREIAAYVAEGSMSPEDAERLLKTEPKGMC